MWLLVIVASTLAICWSETVPVVPTAIAGSTGFTMLVSLIVTDLLTDGLSISGVTTWILAALIVWLAALVAALLLPFLGLKKYLGERRT